MFVFNPVLHHKSGLPVLPTVNEHRSLAKPKKHGCDQCGQHYHYMSQLKKHQRIHTGEKPYGCDQCGQHFSEMSSLKNHQQIHTREKPYGCNHCGQHFSGMANLKRHQRIHTAEKLNNLC